jgi:EAL and modified HD-GYP domain-containing signal transduction protein
MSPFGGDRIAQAPLPGSQASAIELADRMRYVARQPILDLRDRVYGYELLFRGGPEAAFRGDGNMASRTMLDNTVIFGVEKFTGGLPAFLNCTGETLTEGHVIVLPPSMTVLEILETVEPTPALITACQKLKALGFRLALDDFVWEPRFAPLVELADYIKVDFILTGAEGRIDLLSRLKGKAVALLAEKVETQEEYQRARAEGFTLFQGYYFCRPVLMTNATVPANGMFHFEILQLLQSEPIDLRRLGRLVKRDESLSYRLLRMVNSAGFGIRQEVNSIDAALIIVGEEAFRRIALLAIATELSAGRPTEILRMALIRARFCELAAALCSLLPTEQYLLGMLSLLPAMLRIPMEQLTPNLPMRLEILKALEGTANAERRLLTWLEKREHGDWAACEAIVESMGLPQEQVNECYAKAVLWAEDAHRLAD